MNGDDSRFGDQVDGVRLSRLSEAGITMSDTAEVYRSHQDGVTKYNKIYV